MKLLYCDRLRNFGDAMNPWLWERLLPGRFDADAASLFIGVGTLLSDQLPARPTKWVVGAGCGYGDAPRVDDRWRIVCVRGPLTARRLGIDASLALTDPAVLVPELWRARPRSRSGVLFMPHHMNARQADWRAIAGAAGLGYVCPEDDTQSVIRQINGAQLLVTEALHGAIVADALRVPWIAVNSSRHVLQFKWEDWCASVGLPYAPVALPALFDSRGGDLIGQHVRRAIKRTCASVGLWCHRWSPIRPVRSAPAEFARAQQILAALAAGDRATLSSDATLSEVTERWLARIERLRRDLPVQRQPARWRPAPPVVAPARH